MDILLSGDLGEGATSIINSTQVDLVQSILNSYSNKDSSLEQLETSLASAQNISKLTLNTFFDFFKKNVIASFKNGKLEESEKYAYKKGQTFRFTDFVKVTPRSGFKQASYALVNPKDDNKFFCGFRKYNRSNMLIDEQNKQRQRLQRRD